MTMVRDLVTNRIGSVVATTDDSICIWLGAKTVWRRLDDVDTSIAIKPRVTRSTAHAVLPAVHRFVSPPLTGPPPTTTRLELSNQVQGLLPPANLPAATYSALGGVQPDGATVQVNPSGVLSTAALELTTGGTVLTPVASVNVVVWSAPFAALVTNVLGYSGGSAGSVVNARKNGVSKLLVNDLTITTPDTWQDGGLVQNVNVVAGDKLEIMIINVANQPTEIAVQIQCQRGG